MASEMDEVKRQVAIANRVLAEVGLATGVLAALGHASMRLPSEPEKFLVKGRGYANDALARMRPEDMVLCDLEGNKIDGPSGVIQCFEVKMHACIYRARPDVLSVVHVHPRYTVLMSVLKKSLVPMCQEGIQLVRRPLPVYPHVKTVQSEEEGMAVVEALGSSKALILYGHGVAMTGNSLADSVQSTMYLEEQAKMNWYAYCAAGPEYPYISEEMIVEMNDRPRVTELPHFRDLPEVHEVTVGGQPRVEGIWTHYSELVSRDL